MVSIVNVEFDIHGTNPVNTFKGEKVPLTDKGLNWIIPNGSPFFGEPNLVKVYNAKGQKLVLNQDYFLEEEFEPFVKAAGRRIVCFIRLTDAIVLQNAFVTVDYQSIGAWFVPRNSLEDWLTAINSGGSQPIPWDMVFQVPATLPPEYHSHSAKTEIGDWFELTFFFQQLTGIRATRDPDISVKLQTIVDDAYEALFRARDEQQSALNDHARNYNNPHGYDKTTVTLGNVANQATATPAEDLAGTRNDVNSTPYGVIQLAKTFVADTDKAMYNGILPMSSFGGETFIPPSISGSFEGMGQYNEVSGICREPSGILTMLTNHTDGRTDGLYFTTVENYNNANIRVLYTNYKYAPPSLTALGFVPNRIVSGSGNKVIMVGKAGTNNWYLALTDSTFDPAAHSYVKVDMAAVNKDFSNPWGNYDTAVIHYMGDYLVLAQGYRDAEGVSHTRFYRVSTSDVRSGKAVAWELINLTYQTWEGVAVSGPDFKAIAITRDASNSVTKLGPFTAVRPFQSLSLIRRALNVSAEKSGGAGVYYWHMANYYHMALSVAPNFINVAATFEMIYEFNPATGAMVLTFKTPAVTFDALTTTYIGADLNHMDNSMVSNNAPSTVVLSTGDIVSSCVFETGAAFPCSLKAVKLTGRDSEEQAVANPWSIKSQTVQRAVLTNPVVDPPTLNGTGPGSLSYETDGEIFSAINQKTFTREMYCRQVSGGYQVRDGVNNLQVPNLNSRPLTTAIYKANLLPTDGSINFTGTAADLTTGGVECGSSSLSMFGYTSTSPSGWIPKQPELRAPSSSGVAFTFPRTYSRVLDAVNKKATYKADTFYGMRQAILDKLKGYTTDSPVHWTVTWNHLSDEMGGMFKGLNLVIAVVTWTIPTTNKVRTQLLLLRPVVEAPNTSHPGVYLITDFTALHVPANHRQWSGVTSTASPGYYPVGVYASKPLCSLYRNGNSLKMLLQASFLFASAEQGYSSMHTVVDIDLTTNLFSGLFAGSIPAVRGDIACMIPKAGMSDLVLSGNAPETLNIGIPSPLKYDNTGSAAAIYKAAGVSYMTMSVYPDAGWLLFIQDQIRVMINGTVYYAPGGTLDLRDVDAAPQNKTFYLYITVEDDEPKYIISGNVLRKTNAFMRVATLVTNDKQILTVSRESPFMIGDLLLSYTREGGIIPVSTGFPQDTGQFAFLSQSELLP